MYCYHLQRKSVWIHSHFECKIFCIWWCVIWQPFKVKTITENVDTASSPFSVFIYLRVLPAVHHLVCVCVCACVCFRICFGDSLNFHLLLSHLYLVSIVLSVLFPLSLWASSFPLPLILIFVIMYILCIHFVCPLHVPLYNFYYQLSFWPERYYISYIDYYVLVLVFSVMCKTQNHTHTNNI